MAFLRVAQLDIFLLANGITCFAGNSLSILGNSDPGRDPASRLLVAYQGNAPTSCVVIFFSLHKL